MEYALPFEIAEIYGISVKTVYNRMKEYPDDIRIKKQFGKRFVNVKDFEKLEKGYLQNYNSTSNEQLNENTKNVSQKQLGTIENDFEKLQNEYKLVTTEKEQLSKQNRNLTDQANNLAIRLNTEKNEKKELEGRYQELQKDYNTKIESFSLEKLKMMKSYYLVLSISLVCALVLLWIQFPQLLSYFGK